VDGVVYPQPSDDYFSRAIDISHQRDLMIPLSNVVLVYAESIRPEQSLSVVKLEKWK
jgi:hypothetical protein